MSGNQVKLIITTDSTGAVTGIRNVTGALQDMKQKTDETNVVLPALSGRLLGVTAAITALYIAYKKVGEPLKNFISDVTHMAGRYEELGIAMYQVGKNVDYSREEMDSLQAALQRSGIAAIESRETLLRMAASNIDLAESAKLARAAQDLAVVGAMNSSEAFQNLIYGIQSENVRVLRTMGLNVSFEEGYKKIATQLGKTTDELTEFEKTQSRVNTVLEGAKNFEGLYEQAMTSAEKQQRSLTRYIDNYKVAFGEAFQPAYLRMVEAKTEAYKNLIETVSNPEFKDSLKSIADAYATIYEIGSKLVSIIPYIAKTFRDTITLGYELFSLFSMQKRINEVRQIGYPAPITALPSGLMSEADKSRWIGVFEDAKAEAGRLDQTVKKVKDDTSGASDEAKKLANEWASTSRDLEKKIILMDMEGFEKQKKDVELEVEDLRKKFGAKALITKYFDVSLAKIQKEEIEKELADYQEELQKDEDRIIESYKKREDAQKWLTDRINEITQSEFDYKRTKLYEEYQAHADFIGWTEDLYRAFTDDLKKIDDEELKNKRHKLNAIQEAELKHQLALIDLAEQEFRISKPEAIKQRIDANQELIRIQEEYLSQIDKLKDASSWYAQQDAIDRTRQSLLELNLALKEQTGTFKEGLIEGLKRYQRDAQTAFQGGLQVVQDVTSGMKSAFGTFFDYTSDKFMDFGKLATDILNDIYKAVMKALVIEPLVQGLTGGFGELFAPAVETFNFIPQYELHQGGQVAYIPRFDFGGENRLVMAKIGERFITKEQNEWLTSQAKTDKKESNQVQNISITINALDARSFSELVRRNPGAIVAPVMGALKSNSGLRYEIMEGM
jgi:hypothetical protein